jgi:hypothetical protein
MQAENRVEMVGQRFNRLLVLSPAKTRHKRAYWNCLCDCGNTCVTQGKYLRQNKKQSCGCLFRENRLWLSATGVKARQENRMPPGEASFRQLFCSYRGSAAQKSLKFELTQEDLKVLTKQVCFYCGSEPSAVYKPNINGGYTYNGIDRRDSGLGYILSNVVPACRHCNWMKNVYSEESFLNHCALITQYQNNKKENKENVIPQ